MNNSCVRVVALDESAGLAAASFSVVPHTVYASAGDRVAQDILRGLGCRVKQLDVLALPGNGELRECGPDLIIATGEESPAGKEIRSLREVAETAVLPILGNWTDVVAAVGAAVGDEGGRTDSVQAVIRAQLADAARHTEGRSLSVLSNTFGKTTFTMPPSTVLSHLIGESGFRRPEPQMRCDDDLMWRILDPDDLADHDADIIAVPTGGYYTDGVLRESAAFRRLSGVKVAVLGELWCTMNPFSFYAVARDLGEVARGGLPVGETGAVETWTRFLGDIEGAA
ncbi:hypothetical protein OS125_06925 [Corynebacterium sp. P7003]|uniref:ABC transporter substrate-binding protein n=1 Tax=Corynebacterium pygosceleis TaxID=2800406 RepID=A0ABT3WUR6_9CORY|nr:hypothetical protein [Corynebacterium pygosceleis]MCX7444980.1 hypothetical protein [Corynebacterium pygosceleis]